ncbi:DUF1508 domain-containing protein [Undibacterium sp.]|uniref:YegP family protein n=1 Tax=Undibacterium sp. TaxID=1914977 RepID=UPI00272F577E|nr:DUF1508 domain-containing protein [Undibacterium sp.]MDP1980567.1 DUF1508 domain-containing protein [Undibacterium sp.]
MYFEIYSSTGLLNHPSTQWRWRLKAANHETIASGESYYYKADCLHAIDLVKSTNANTPVKDLG